MKLRSTYKTKKTTQKQMVRGDNEILCARYFLCALNVILYKKGNLKTEQSEQ